MNTTIEACKHEIAKEHNFENWQELLDYYEENNISPFDEDEIPLDIIIEQLAELYHTRNSPPSVGIEKSKFKRNFPKFERKEINGENLLPCPLCGSSEITISGMYPHGQYYVECDACRLSLWDDRRDKAIGHWNCRDDKNSIIKSQGIDGKKLVDWVEEEKMAEVDEDGCRTGRHTVYVDELISKIQSLIPITEAGTEEVQEVCCKCPYPIWGQDTAMNYYCKNCHLPMASLHPLNYLNP